MIHSRDDEVGVAHEIKSPKNQPQFPDDDGAVLVRNKLSDWPKMLATELKKKNY